MRLSQRWHPTIAQFRLIFICMLLVSTLSGCIYETTLQPTEVPSPTAAPTTLAVETPSPTLTPTPRPSPTPTLTTTPTCTLVAGPLAPLITAGRAETGIIALTFDQGVRGAGETPRVLDILRDGAAPSTFFLIGVWAENNPDLVRRMVAEGHQIANHTYDHPNLTNLTDAEITQQMEQTEAIIAKITGKTTKPYMRPPSGSLDNRVLALMQRLGYAVVYWTLDSTDWRRESTPETIVNWVIEKAKPGDIVVFHGYSPKTAEALPAIVKGLKAKGYRFGTLSQVLGR